MKNKKFLFAACAAAMLAVNFTACSNDTATGENAAWGSVAPEQVVIDWMGRVDNHLGTGTRATAITTSNYLDAQVVPSMQVWGYFSHNVTSGDGINAGDQYVGTSGAGIIIDNGGDNSWGYHNASEQAYWPKQNLNFYAMIPSSDASITSATATVSDKLAHVVASVTVPEDQSAQKDIMFAKAINQTPRTANANTPVSFLFNHAMTQVAFSGKCAAEKISVEVSDIKIANADKSGTVGFISSNSDKDDVELSSALASSRAYGKFSIGLVDDATLDGSKNVENAKNLTATDGVLMMLPQTGATKWATTSAAAVSISDADDAHQTYLAITCKIKNGDVYLVGSESATETVYIPFEISWQQGKKYTYTLIFGAGSGAFDEDGNPLDSMLPITYEVSGVTDWEAVEGGDISF